MSSPVGETTAPQNLKRKRGRPRKSEPAADQSDAQPAEKRPRGRPRKSVVTNIPEAFQSREENMDGEDEQPVVSGEVVAKPARGRPKKIVVQDSVLVLDGEDREVGDPAQEQLLQETLLNGETEREALPIETVVENEPDLVKKPRGRPRKSEIVQDLGAGVGDDEEAVEDSVMEEPAAKKPRGRPKKSTASVPASTTTTNRKPIGRPRKYATEEERKAVAKRYRETFKARKEARELQAAEARLAQRDTSESAVNDDSAQYNSASEMQSPGHEYTPSKIEIASLTKMLNSVMKRQQDQDKELEAFQRMKIEVAALKELLNTATKHQLEQDKEIDELKWKLGELSDSDQRDPLIEAESIADDNSSVSNDDLVAVIGDGAQPVDTQGSIPVAKMMGALNSQIPAGDRTLLNTWSKASRDVYAWLKRPEIPKNGLHLGVLAARTGLGESDVKQATGDLIQHGIIYTTAKDTFVLLDS